MTRKRTIQLLFLKDVYKCSVVYTALCACVVLCVIPMGLIIKIASRSHDSTEKLRRRTLLLPPSSFDDKVRIESYVLTQQIPRQAREPDEHAVPRQAREPDEHAVPEEAREPVEHAVPRQAREPDEHAIPRQAREPDEHIVIVIPYRDRAEHYTRFIEHLPSITRDNWRIHTILVEQNDNKPFNRGWLLNIGIGESKKRFGDMNPCVVTHDVDMLADSNVDYSWCDRPTLACSQLSCFNNRIPYRKYSGGVVQALLNDWYAVNGYTNIFEGWGGEDDDLYHRFRLAGLLRRHRLRRPKRGFGKCKCIDNSPSSEETKRRHKGYKNIVARVERMKHGSEEWKTEGLSSLQYRIDEESVDEYGTVHLKVEQQTFPIALHWINLERSLDRRQNMEQQLRDMPDIASKRIEAVTVQNIIQLYQNGRIRTNGFDLAKRTDTAWKMHIKRTYSYVEAACLFSHIRSWEKIAAGNNEFGLVTEDDIEFAPKFYEKLLHAMQTAPDDWEVLQLHTNNQQVREHGSVVDVDWIQWLPHHWGTLIYVMRKTKALDLLYSIKKDNSYTFSYENVLVADEYTYWKGKTYTYTQNIVYRAQQFDSIVQAGNQVLTQGWEKRLGIMPRINIASLDSTLAIFTVLTVNTRDEFDEHMAQLNMEVDTMNSVYTDDVDWYIVCVARSTSDIEYIQEAFQQFEAHVNSHVHHDTGWFSKWKYMYPLFKHMGNYDDVLYKDFDQSLVGLPWKTLIQKRGNAVISSVLREARHEGMIRELIAGKMHGYWKMNDARWFRTHRTPFAWASVQPEERDFLEMYFVLFDGNFATWFFSKIFDNQVFRHPRSDWGPDKMWCGAAKEWSTQRTPCVFVPIVSVHYDTRTLKDYEGIVSNVEWNEPVVAWSLHQPYKKWLKYSERYLHKMGRLK